MVKKYNKKSCHLEYTLSMFGSKWKTVILWYLGVYGVHRYDELQKILTGITSKMLTSSLKELEADSLIIRKQYNQIPPKVEYSISERGLTLMPIILAMYDWGKVQN